MSSAMLKLLNKASPKAGCTKHLSLIIGRSIHSSTPAESHTTEASSPTRPYMTENHYIARPGEKFKDERYEAIRKLGTGRYSHVWLARDRLQKSCVALKILTPECYGGEKDCFEIEILKTVSREQAKLDNPGSSHVRGLLDNFQLKGPSGKHECLVMPALGCSLSAQERRFLGRRVPVKVMRQVTRQLLQGLAFLHDKSKVIHTDLHLDNIHVKITPSQIEEMAAGSSAEAVTPTFHQDHMDNIDISIIDFDFASWVDRNLSNNIQPEDLRAPEVWPGAPWGPPIDIWSLACLVIELMTGHFAFTGMELVEGECSSDVLRLAQHIEILEPMPKALLQRSSRRDELFDDEGRLALVPDIPVGGHSLQKYVDGSEWPWERPDDMSASEAEMFVDFLTRALRLDPEERATASELLQHEWLRVK